MLTPQAEKELRIEIHKKSRQELEAEIFHCWQEQEQYAAEIDRLREVINQCDKIQTILVRHRDLAVKALESIEWIIIFPEDKSTAWIDRNLVELALKQIEGRECPPHSWDDERCIKCGDKDWMTG